MKHAMLHAFSEHLLNTDAAFKAAIEDACKPEKVQAILTEAAMVSHPTVGYEKTVTETEWGAKHQWRREDPNGNKCMVTIINPTPAQLDVIEKFTKAG